MQRTAPNVIAPPPPPPTHTPKASPALMSLLKSRAIDGKSSRGIPHFGGKWEQREYGGGGVPQAKTEQTDAEIVAMEQRLRVRARVTDMYYILNSCAGNA